MNKLFLNSYLPHYRVRSKDAALNERVGSDHTFTTSGCTVDASIISQTTSDIASSSGGSLSLLASGNGLTLTVPSSFSGSDANSQIKSLDAQTALSTTKTPSGYTLVGSYLYDLHALSGVSTAVTLFDQPLTATLSYADSDLTGLDEDSLVIYRWDGSIWTALTGCTINKSANTISCQTTHFSVFALFAKELVTQTNNNSSGSSSSSSSPSTSTCTATPPSYSPNLYQIDTLKDSAALYFVPAGSPVTSYTIYYGPLSSPEQYAVTFDQGSSTGAISYTINHLVKNSTYTFKVRGANTCAQGGFSGSIRATTSSVKHSFYPGKTSATYLPIRTAAASKSVSKTATQTVVEPTLSEKKAITQPTSTPLPLKTEAPIVKAPVAAPKPQTSFWSNILGIFGVK